MDGPIYLDYKVTTPVDPRVAQAALPYLTHHFGNPSSGHWYADEPRAALAAARAQVANLIGAEPDNVVFTGSGREADALAIQGGVLATHGRHVITRGHRASCCPRCLCDPQPLAWHRHDLPSC